jgi:hypothetical protein
MYQLENSAHLLPLICDSTELIDHCYYSYKPFTPHTETCTKPLVQALAAVVPVTAAAVLLAVRLSLSCNVKSLLHIITAHTTAAAALYCTCSEVVHCQYCCCCCCHHCYAAAHAPLPPLQLQSLLLLSTAAAAAAMLLCTAHTHTAANTH